MSLYLVKLRFFRRVSRRLTVGSQTVETIIKSSSLRTTRGRHVVRDDPVFTGQRLNLFDSIRERLVPPISMSPTSGTVTFKSYLFKI